MAIRLVAEKYNGASGSMNVDDARDDLVVIKKRIASLDAAVEKHWQELCGTFVEAQLKPLKETIEELLKEVRSLHQEQPEYLSTEEVAALLKVRTWTITKWAREGKLPFKQAGKLYRFTRKDVFEMMKGENNVSR